MSTKAFNLGLMAFWLLLCGGLLTREYWMTPELLEKVNGPNTPRVIYVAFALAAWNGVRVWSASNRRKAVAPSPEADAIRRRIRGLSAEDPRVVNPEFQFDETPRDRP